MAGATPGEVITFPGPAGELRGFLAAAAAPAGAAEAPPAVPGARAAIGIDARDGTVMFAKHPDAERAIASTTKLMTALLALEQARASVEQIRTRVIDTVRLSQTV